MSENKRKFDNRFSLSLLIQNIEWFNNVKTADFVVHIEKRKRSSLRFFTKYKNIISFFEEVGLQLYYGIAFCFD